MDPRSVRGGEGPGGQDLPPIYWGPPNFMKRKNKLCACARMRSALIVNSFPNPLSEILYLPLQVSILKTSIRLLKPNLTFNQFTNFD